MARKPTPPQPDAQPSLATAGGSYVADEAAGAVRQEGPSETPPPSRRGFGNPQSGIPAAQSAGAPDGVATATPNTSQE